MHHTRFLFSVVLTLVLINGCADESTAGITADQLYTMIKDSISEEDLPVDGIESLDPYESYFLAIKAREADYNNIAVLLARHCWKNSEPFIAERAAELVISTGIESGNYESAEFFASLAAAEFPDSYFFHRAVVESEYWRHEYDAVLETLKSLGRFSEVSDDGETFLFRAVSAFHTGMDEWKNEWIRLADEVIASEYIRRGWDYLQAVSNYNYSDFDEYASLVEAKYSQASGKYKDAAAAYKNYLDTVSAETVSETTISDIEKLYFHTGSAAGWASLLEDKGPGNAEFLFAAARLYRRGGKYTDADRCMERVLSLREGAVTDRELWYSFDIKSRRNPRAAVELLGSYIARWNNPEFYSDTLDNLCTSLASSRRWSDIVKLGSMLEHSGPSSVYDRCRYISERALSLGLVDDVSFTVPYTENYYRLLSGGELPELSNLTDSDRLSMECPFPVDPATLSGPERYIDGLLRYNAGSLLEEIQRFGPGLSESFLACCAAGTVDAGRPLDSIRIMYKYNGPYSAAGYAAMYPDLYRREIEDAASRNNIPVQLLFGLVWKESGFENDIVSRSGAVGLSQLMPSTAEDIAGRLRKEVMDLTDPGENLELGAWYLNWLVGYVGNTASAVLSYNGGPGRVRNWLRTYSDLPDDLLYEVVPVPETHNYGKKVLEASVIYGLLYYGVEPERTLRIFFQE